jgi:hypothetical protein
MKKCSVYVTEYLIEFVGEMVFFTQPPSGALEFNKSTLGVDNTPDVIRRVITLCSEVKIQPLEENEMPNDDFIASNLTRVIMACRENKDRNVTCKAAIDLWLTQTPDYSTDKLLLLVLKSHLLKSMGERVDETNQEAKQMIEHVGLKSYVTDWIRKRLGLHVTKTNHEPDLTGSNETGISLITEALDLTDASRLIDTPDALTLKRKDWFSNLTTCTEHNLLVSDTKLGECIRANTQNRRQLMVHPQAPSSDLPVLAGSFFNSKTLELHSPKDGDPFATILILTCDEANKRRVDFSWLQSDRRYANAVFQIECNLQAMQTISTTEEKRPTDYLTNYYKEESQAYNAVIGTGAALIARYFTGNKADDAEYDDHMIDTRKHILFDAKEKWSLVPSMGITNEFGVMDLQKYPRLRVEADPDQDIGDTFVSYQSRAQVSFFTGNQQNLYCVPPRLMQTVDQVFTPIGDFRSKSAIATIVNAAISQSNPTVGELNSKVDKNSTIRKRLLSNAYNGAYGAARKEGRKHLVLSLIGANYGFEISHIIQAMIDAHQLYSSALERVTLPIELKHSKHVDALKARLKAAKIPYTHYHYAKNPTTRETKA